MMSFMGKRPKMYMYDREDDCYGSWEVGNVFMGNFHHKKSLLFS